VTKSSSTALDGGLVAGAAAPVTAEERHRLISEAAYYLALKRGFAGGNPEGDWLQAEQEINNALLDPSRAAQKAAARKTSGRKTAQPKQEATRGRH